MITADSRRLPRDLVDEVVVAIYAAADLLDWDHLPASAKTQRYDEWVRDASIGGVLARYMSSENARSWIKDGPMKEYSRARVGAGRYAKFGSALGPTPEQLARHALGSSAMVAEKSFGTKPFHCLAVSSSTTTYVVWGSAKNVRHLVWAAINHLAKNPTHEASIVIMETLEHPTTNSDRTRNARIAERCGITITYYRTTSNRRPAS
jgi:hypothetical protein